MIEVDQNKFLKSINNCLQNWHYAYNRTQQLVWAPSSSDTIWIKFYFQNTIDVQPSCSKLLHSLHILFFVGTKSCLVKCTYFVSLFLDPRFALLSQNPVLIIYQFLQLLEYWKIILIREEKSIFLLTWNRNLTEFSGNANGHSKA